MTMTLGQLRAATEHLSNDTGLYSIKARNTKSTTLDTITGLQIESVIITEDNPLITDIHLIVD